MAFLSWVLSSDLKNVTTSGVGVRLLRWATICYSHHGYAEAWCWLLLQSFPRLPSCQLHAQPCRWDAYAPYLGYIQTSSGGVTLCNLIYTEFCRCFFFLLQIFNSALLLVLQLNILTPLAININAKYQIFYHLLRPSNILPPQISTTNFNNYVWYSSRICVESAFLDKNG